MRMTLCHPVTICLEGTISLVVEKVTKETENLAINGEPHPTDLPPDGEASDTKEASNKDKEKQQMQLEPSELETFWRYYIA